MVRVPPKKADLLLTNVRMLFRGAIIESGFAIKDGLILKIGKESQLPPAELKVDGKGNLVLPGAIDVHVHLRDQMLAYKETFETGTAAAIAGGVTTVLDMPNNRPPTNTIHNLRERMQTAQGRIYCNVGFYAAPNRESNQTALLLKEGVFGLKVNMLKPIGQPLTNAQTRRSMQEVSKRHKVVIFHAEDGAKVRSLEKTLKRARKASYDDFLRAHPPSSEISATQGALSHAKVTGCSSHIAHVSCAASLRKILAEKENGVHVTSEVTPHHLLLDAKELAKLKGLGIMTPPLRSSTDRGALWKALAAGDIEICASDHAPHSWSEKSSENVWDISPGVSGLDIFMPILITHAQSFEISLQRLAEATSQNPAEIFGVSNRGLLERGFQADFIIIDTKVRTRVDADEFKSKAKFSPFEGWPLTASIVSTYLNGVCVFSGGEIIRKPSGSVLRSFRDNAEIPSRQHAG